MIGIIAASEDEIHPILDAMRITETKEKSLVEFNIGEFADQEIVAAFSGVCKVNAAIAIQNMIDLFDPSLIYVTGVAGALDDKYSIGDTIIIHKVAHHDMASEILTEYHPYMDTIWYQLNVNELSIDLNEDVFIDSIVSGEQFINPQNKKHIGQDLKVHCVDMESAAYAQVCYANRIPLIIIKTITDNTDENGHEIFEENVEVCSKKSASIVLSMIERS